MFNRDHSDDFRIENPSKKISKKEKLFQLKLYIERLKTMDSEYLKAKSLFESQKWDEMKLFCDQLFNQERFQLDLLPYFSEAEKQLRLIYEEKCKKINVLQHRILLTNEGGVFSVYEKMCKKTDLSRARILLKIISLYDEFEDATSISQLLLDRYDDIVPKIEFVDTRKDDDIVSKISKDKEEEKLLRLYVTKPFVRAVLEIINNLLYDETVAKIYKVVPKFCKDMSKIVGSYVMAPTVNKKNSKHMDGAEEDGVPYKLKNENLYIDTIYKLLHPAEISEMEVDQEEKYSEKDETLKDQPKMPVEQKEAKINREMEKIKERIATYKFLLSENPHDKDIQFELLRAEDEYRVMTYRMQRGSGSRAALFATMSVEQSCQKASSSEVPRQGRS